MGCSAGAGCPLPPTRPFGFVVFKVNMSSSLGVAAAAAAAATLDVCVYFVEGGLEFSLTIEAQDFIECMNAIN